MEIYLFILLKDIEVKTAFLNTLYVLTNENALFYSRQEQ